MKAKLIHAVVIIYLMTGISLAGNWLYVMAQSQEKKPGFLNSSNIVNTPTTGNSIPFLNKSHSVTILSHKSYVDTAGFLHVVGEVQNNTPNPIQLVKINSTYYSSNNQVVATDFTYTDPSGISAGDKAPFELILISASIPISEIDHYNLVASYE